jgi:hypothetical protein
MVLVVEWFSFVKNGDKYFKETNINIFLGKSVLGSLVIV